MSTKEIGNKLIGIFLMMIGGLFVLPALAVVEEPSSKDITVTATIEPIFDVSFGFYKDLDGCDEDEDLGTPLQGEAPPLVFTVIPNPVLPTEPDDPLFAMVGKETYRVLVGVINNTGTQYTITQAATALEGPGGSRIDGAFIVNSFIDIGNDPKHPRDTTVGTCINGGNCTTGTIAQASQTAQLYTSLDAVNNPGTVVQIVYAITDGYGCGGTKSGYTSDDLVGIGKKAGQYTGQVTLTVDWQG